MPQKGAEKMTRQLSFSFLFSIPFNENTKQKSLPLKIKEPPIKYLIKKRWYEYAFSSYKIEYLTRAGVFMGRKAADSFEAEEAEKKIEELKEAELKAGGEAEFSLIPARNHLKQEYYIEGQHHPALKKNLIYNEILENKKRRTD